LRNGAPINAVNRAGRASAMTEGPPIYDSHIHLAGTAEGGSGCRLHPSFRRSIRFGLLRRCAGIRRHELRSGLEHAILARLRTWLGEAPRLRVVLLAMDRTYDDRGTARDDLTDLHTPNDLLLEAAASHPRILPGASVHPYRPDAVETLRRCAEGGAALVKWLPASQNIDLADPRCRPFFEAMRELGLPLLCHTGSEGAVRNLRKEENDPLRLRPALEAGVTVVAAHAAMRSLPHDRDYHADWRRMLADYPHLYGDTAAWFGLRARRAARTIPGDDLALSRLVHGSDWPIPNSPWWFLWIVPFFRIRALARIRNPLLRDIETKRALGLPAAVFERFGRLLPQQMSC
jgi:hypothetical protein